MPMLTDLDAPRSLETRPTNALTAASPAAAIPCTGLVDGLERTTLLACERALSSNGRGDAGWLSAGPSSASFELRSFAGISLADLATPGGRLASSGSRTEERQLIVWVQLRGTALLQQGERETRLETGDLCLLRDSRPTRVELSTSRLLLIQVPERHLADRFPLWKSALLRRIPVNGGAPAVFVDAARSLQRWHDSIDGIGSETIASTFLDLIGAVACFVAPSDRSCIERSLLQRERVKRFVRQHLRNPELSVELIADATEVSARQIHRLFADESLSLMRWIWTQRLEHCYRELTQADPPERSVSEIAFAWGFNDQAHFSRAFRRHFGLSPREARAQSLSASSARE